jgi:DHA2 family methylenomycin A resistance protein-like MFS transporter
MHKANARSTLRRPAKRRTSRVDRIAAMTCRSGTPAAPSFTLVVLATCMAFVVGQLDVTIVNVALPAIAADLQASVAELQWVVDAYAVSFAAFMLSAGAFGDRFGARRAFQWGMGIFCTASIACAAAPGIVALDAARVLQGFGAATMLPNSLALLNHALAHDPARRARGIGYWTAAGSISIALGPVLGGLLVTSVGWPAIFWVNVPLCVAGGWLSTHLHETPTHPAKAPLDIAGQVLATLALAALIATLIESRSLGLSDPRIWDGAAATLVLAVALLLVERRAGAPVIATDLFALRDFRGAVLFGTLVNGTYYGAIFVIALYLQNARHFTPMQAGLAFLPLTAGFFLSNVLSGRASARFGTRKPMIVGALVDLLGFGVLAWASAQHSLPLMLAGFLLIPTGMGLAVPAMTTTVLSAVDKSRSALAAAMLNTARQSAGAIGVAVFGALAHGDAAQAAAGLQVTCVVSMLALACATWAAARLEGVPPHASTPRPGSGSSSGSGVSDSPT